MALGIIDILLLTISILASAGIGIYQGIMGLKATPTEYMLGGKNMHPIPLALSMTVGTVSAITIMANAGEMYAYGTQLWMMDLGIAVGLVIVAKVFIPIFYPMKMVSLYQYVEARFKSKYLRQFTVIMTMVQAYAFIGFLLYPPTIMLYSITNLNTYLTLFIVGVSSTIYSSFGGVKAVVYTDAFQSIIMIVGVLAIVLQAASSVGGLAAAWDIAYHKDRIEFFNFNLDPYQRHSFWLTVVYGLFFSLSTYGVNQCQIQRAFSTGSLRQAQLVFYYAAIGMVVLRGLIHLSGVMVFAYYSECDPLTTSKYSSPVTIITTYVLTSLIKIPGLTGLFVASIYAAVLSSVSTQVNSLTALLWEDFLKNRPYFKDWDDLKVTKLQKVLVLASGVIGMLSAWIVSNMISFLQALLSITGAISGPMIGLFLVAIFIPWVRDKAVTMGYVVGVIISLWIVIGQLAYANPVPFLPMSYNNCSEGYTIYHNITSTESYRGEGFYGLSYCLNFCWGSVACVLVAIIASLFLENNTPETVNEKYIHPWSWKYFYEFHQQRRESKSLWVSLCHCCPCFKKQNPVEDVELNAPKQESIENNTHL